MYRCWFNLPPPALAGLHQQGAAFPNPKQVHFSKTMSRNCFLAHQNVLKTWTAVLDGGVQNRNQKVKEHFGEWVVGLTLQRVPVHPPHHSRLRSPTDGAFDEHVWADHAELTLRLRHPLWRLCRHRQQDLINVNSASAAVTQRGWESHSHTSKVASAKKKKPAVNRDVPEKRIIHSPKPLRFH